MKRIDRIIAHPDFRRALTEIEACEACRPFCGHGTEHLLSTARLGALIAADEGIDVSRPLLYAAALLHDIGRAEESLRGEPHEAASLRLAGPILRDCGFSPDETAEVLTAIAQHRSAWQGERTQLGALLYRADKESRPCFCCPAAETCNWPAEKRNLCLLR